MNEQHWRKALWHLRHGGLNGLRQYRKNVAAAGQPTTDLSEDYHADAPSQGGVLMLSVIVPAYNASDFIVRCLNSILNQTGVSLEVIVIDDGSIDGTADVTAEFAGRDSGVTILRTENCGPAAAREWGVSAARGTYIAFADADDEVLPGAYATMIDSLKRTGSDIATGSYVRVGAQGRSRPKLTARVHARQRLAVRLADMPELLEEPVLWNKVYDRAFWHRHVGEMSSFSNYEDQEPVYRAFVGAAAIDVLTDDVYAWRLADGRNTRSRRKGRLTDLHARLDVIEALRVSLVHEPENVRRFAYSVWMGTDLAMHAEYLDTASKKFRKALKQAAATLRREMPREAWALIPAKARLFMWVVAKGRLDDIEEVLGTRAEETAAVPLLVEEGHWVVAPSYMPRLRSRIPSRLLRARTVDFRPTLIVRNARWVGAGVIELAGCAWVPGIDPGELEVTIHGVMDGSTEFEVPVETVNDNRIDLEVGDPWRSYATGGFTVSLDLSRIDDVSPRGIQLLGAFDADGIHLTTPATSTTVVGMVAPSPIVKGNRVTVAADAHDELSILPVALPASPILAAGVSISGETIVVHMADDSEVRTVDLVSRGETIAMRKKNAQTFDAVLPDLPERYHSGGERQWSVTAHLDDGSTADVYYSDIDYLLPGTGRVRIEPNIEGAVRLAQRHVRVTVTGASSDRDRLLLTGRVDPAQKLSIVLRASEQTIAPVETMSHGDGSFTAVYNLTTEGAEGGTVAAMAGGYHVRFGPDPDHSDGWARVAGKLAIRPVDIFTEWNTLRVEGKPSGTVAIMASPPWSAQERTRFGRFALRNREWGPVDNGILFESYNGKSANDSPRAIFEAIRELDESIPLYWSVRDRRVDVPDGGISVVEGTAAWHRALATSRLWVNNNNFPYYVWKRPGQYYLQTWHGTPIKKLLWDIPRRKVPLTYRRLMMTEVPQWDLLLAQSEEAAKNLRSGLGYEGEISIMEYPRNGRLSAGLNDPVAIRRRLGIATDKPVVLYMPTWRKVHRNGQQLIWDDLIPTKAFARCTGATLLLRAHHVATAQQITTEEVKDVSDEPHVEDLLAVANLLITDYSSVVYDYGITGRPVVFFTPDLQSYVKERGFYSAVSSRIAATNANALVEVVNENLGKRDGPEAICTEMMARQTIDLTFEIKRIHDCRQEDRSGGENPKVEGRQSGRKLHDGR